MADAARSGDGRHQALTAPRATIFALSSGAPPAGIAVVRISGPGAGTALRQLTRRPLPEPRSARLATLRDHSGAVLDRALVLWFPGPASATGEDIVELHLHGGRAVIAAVLDALAIIDGLRPAEAGEFTRRAFANGRIDLTEAEGLGDLLQAETQAERRHALGWLEGGLRRLIAEWQAQLNRAAAQIEAVLDHADEGDVDVHGLDDALALAATVSQAISDALAAPPAERLRDGVRIVFAGQPNAGKSSLINALSERDASIVSPIAGTTRDIVEVPLDWDGLPVLLQDTAGLRAKTEDAVEAIGIERARDVLQAADIVVALDDSVLPAPNVLRISAKADLAVARDERLAVSVKSGEGLDTLRSLLIARARSVLPGPGRVSLNARHRAILREAIDHLAELPDAPDLVVQAELIRSARTALDRVTGRGDVESMLDALFERFCIGK